MRNLIKHMLMPATAAAALALTGCGDAADEEAATLNMEDPAALDAANGMIEGDAMAGGAGMAGEGTEASLEPATMRSEVERLQRDMTAQNVTLTDPATNPDATFAQLDRNSDGRLSPAEYAIYDLSDVNPDRQGAKDDEQAPFVSDEALNMSITGFRRHDSDGNFFLSPAEFTAGVRA